MLFSKALTPEENKKLAEKIGFLTKWLDILRKLVGIMTQVEKLKTEQMVREVAKGYVVDADVLVAVIWAESNMDPKCITKNPNGTTDYGLCQFNDYWYSQIISPWSALNEPEVAVKVMCQRWEMGWAKDWIAYRNKSYLKYLHVEKNR